MQLVFQCVSIPWPYGVNSVQEIIAAVTATMIVFLWLHFTISTPLLSILLVKHQFGQHSTSHRLVKTGSEVSQYN
ncbi:hypothetical protein L208DRAFT_1407496, partial [Tricholoma matsutake]